MGRNRTKSPEEKDAENGAPPKKHRSGSKSKRKIEVESETDSESEEGRKPSSRSKRKKRSRSKRTSRNEDDSHSSYSEDEDSESESESSEYSSEEERRRRKKRERRRREEREEKERRRRKKEKEKRRKKDKDEGDKKKRKKKNKDSERGKKGAVTDSWGKYGIIRETDMWNKRPEFTAWLAEVKQVNLESLPNWEEKQMFKQFMEDHNTATFPSKKYYNLDAYFKHQMEKEMKKGVKKVQTEWTVFNDEEIRRQEMQQARERQKEKQVEALKCEMQSGMAQAMKEQAQLREEMAYQYKLGNFEAAAAIQRRLDPDVPT